MQMAQKKMYERLEKVAADDFAAGVFDEQLSEIFYAAVQETVADPRMRARLREFLGSALSRLHSDFE